MRRPRRPWRPCGTRKGMTCRARNCWRSWWTETKWSVPGINSGWGRSASLLLLLAGVTSAAAGDSYFDARVAPILRARCLGCHNEVLRNGGVSFWGRDGLLKGGVHGPTLVAGKPAASLLVHAVRQDGPLS